jgi:hypothetical protein
MLASVVRDGLSRLIFCAVTLACSSAFAADRPNVVFIVADDMGFADMGTQGARGFKTPHLDRMAAEGTRFTNFYVARGVQSHEPRRLGR